MDQVTGGNTSNMTADPSKLFSFTRILASMLELTKMLKELKSSLIRDITEETKSGTSSSPDN